jgi:hypothetical protein
MDLQELGFGVWPGLIWLRIGTGGGLRALVNAVMNYWVAKMRRIS